jgi:hypothetical protein
MLQPRLALLLLKRVKDQLNAARDPELLVNPKEVVTYGVLGQAQFVSHVSVGEAVGDEFHNVVFTLGEQLPPL